jgi:hypothetical protein
VDTPPWLDELTLRAGPPWHHLGTRALPSDPWREHARADDPEARTQLAATPALRRDAHDVVVARHPASDGLAAAEAEVGAWITGADGASLEDAARAVPEDLCVLVRRGDRWCLDAGVVCFPSVWRIADKVGLPLAEVHGPVPAYADELAARVDRALDALRPDRPAWRRNWFVHATDVLHLPDPPSPPAGPVPIPDGLWLRSERQTLHRLPGTGAILFTIRTQQAPLAAVAGRPDLAARMAAALRSWSPALVDYRSAAPWLAGAVTWLEAVGRTTR